MHTSLDLRILRQFCEDRLFKQPIRQFVELTRGGSSFNFVATTNKDSFVVKLIDRTHVQKIQRLRDILRYVSKHPFFQTADVFIQDHYALTYGDFEVIVIRFIKGRSINHPTKRHMIGIMRNYAAFRKIRLEDKNIDFPTRQPVDLYTENKQKLEQLQTNAGCFRRLIIKHLLKINERLFQNAPKLPLSKTIIHGDAGLNNILQTQDDKIAFLDFELCRYGYITEDAVDLMCSAVLRCLFKRMSYCKRLFHILQNKGRFTTDEWQYALSMHFLNVVRRRLSSGKLFKSVRKDLMFLYLLTMYDKMCQIFHD